MSQSTPLKTYRLILYASQFVVSPKALSSLSKSLPKLLTTLHINDQSARINLIETVRAFVEDYESVSESRSPNSQLASRTSRALIQRFFAVFGILVTAASIRKIALNMKTTSLLLKSNLTPTDLIDPARYASTASILSTALPFLRTKIPNSINPTIVLAALSLALMPEGYPKDYASMYALCQGTDAIFNKYKDNTRLKTFLPSYWFVVPLSLSQLLHQASTSPDHLPGMITRLFSVLFSGLIEKKPVWYNAEWPKTIDTFVQVKKTRRVNRGLIHSEVTLTRTNPVHKNVRMSILSPSEPSLANVFKKQLPRKFILLFLSSLPIFYSIYRFQDRKSSSTSSTYTTSGPSSAVMSTSAGTSYQDDFEAIDDINEDITTKLEEVSTLADSKDDIISGSTQLDHYITLSSSSSSSSPPSTLQRALISSGKFTGVTLGSLITSYILFTTRVDPRLNGLISGLWWYAYRESGCIPMFAYLARITRLAMFRQRRDTCLKSKSPVVKGLGRYGSTIVGSLAVALLVRIHDQGGDLGGRFNKITKYIKTGGDVDVD